MRKIAFAAAIPALLLITVQTASASTIIHWADLEQAGTNGVQGTITLPTTDVNVTYSGQYGFAQTNGGTYYWTGDAYTFGGDNHAPLTSDIIALGTGGMKTIAFDQTVSDVYLALISWNGNSGTFDQPFEVVSSGSGFWGSGSFNTVGGPPHTTFTGSGEPHGIIRFTGSFNTVSFTDLDENWHGIQIGIAALAPPPSNGAVPEPSTWAMMLLGFFGVGGAMRFARRKQKVTVSYA